MMNLLGLLKNALQQGFRTLSGRASGLFRRPRKPIFPLADRILADAFRLGQLPSPTDREQIRAVFVAERLKALDLPYTVDDAGNILARLHSYKDMMTDITYEPLLVFTSLVSDRWNPLESLGRLELQYAQGAGLADALGPAALLSLAEAYASGRLTPDRDLLLLFSGRHFDDPYSDSFSLFTSDPRHRPVAAIGVRGFMLGFLPSHTLGSYRVELIVTEDEKQKGDPNGVVNALLDTAGRFREEAESSGDALHLYFRRIEAQSSFSRTPPEGVLELDLESGDKLVLDGALEKIRNLAENTAFPAITKTFRVISSIPPGDPSVSGELTRILSELMKELKIKAEEEAKADPSSFLSALGIPALSVGIASGREGLNRDTVEIASIEKGRQLLERLVMILGG
jgi:hypothetical protein